jgi:hypothetical protein
MMVRCQRRAPMVHRCNHRLLAIETLWAAASVGEITQRSQKTLPTTFIVPADWLRWFAPRNWDCVVHESRQAKVLKLARYFAVAGVVVVAGLIEANAVLGPGGLGLSLVRDQPKARSVRRPQAVSLERPRDEGRTQSSTVEAAPSRTQSTIVTTVLPARLAQTPTFPNLVGLPTPEETAHATRLAQEKTKAGRAKRRLARERARARAIAVRRLDQYSDGQPTPRDYAYAPRQTYGPFNQTQTGWGNGWSRRWDTIRRNLSD